jgi:hypothetical protein
MLGMSTIVADSRTFDSLMTENRDMTSRKYHAGQEHWYSRGPLPAERQFPV